MAFVNEYIPKEDFDKYDLRMVCGAHNRVVKGYMYSDQWAIDRERDAFLLKVWSHREAEFDGVAFYWKGTWMFFEMRHKTGKNPEDGSRWIRYLIKGFSIPPNVEAERDAIHSVLQDALSTYCGAGVYSDCDHCTATIDFIGK